MKKIRCLRVDFSGEIAAYEIPAFRGAIIHKVGQDHILFHNHQGENGFRYMYPLIQYKRVHQKPVLFCLDEGVDEIHQFFQQRDWTINISGRQLDMKIDRMDMKQYTMQVWDRMFSYRIGQWVALNQEAYRSYQQMEGLVDQIRLLEKILTGNILSFAKGIGWTIEKEVLVKITDLERIGLVNLKSQKVMAFTLSFQSNVFLPDYTGLGKSVSIGFGMVQQYKNRN